jgi:hypothetical protein
MRHQPHHRLFAARGQADVALDMDQALQPRRAGVPEQAALEQAAAEPAEMLAQQGLALGGRLVGKSELQVAPRDAPPAAAHAVQQRAETPADGGLQAQRQPVQQPEQAQDDSRGHSLGPL